MCIINLLVMSEGHISRSTLLTPLWPRSFTAGGCWGHIFVPSAPFPFFLSWHFWCFSSSSGTASCAFKCGWWNQDYKWRVVFADAGWLAENIIPQAGMICNCMLECIIKWTNPKVCRIVLILKTPEEILDLQEWRALSKKTRRCRVIPDTRTFLHKDSCTEASLEVQLLVGYCSSGVTKN